MKFSRHFFILLMLTYGLVAVSQNNSVPGAGKLSPVSHDSSSVKTARPDTDRDDIPFIDYHPTIVWTSPNDSLHAIGYMRKNFTDQFISVWNPPGRFYRASRIYAAALNGNYYRAVNVSPRNWVFAQQMVCGNLNLYIYPRIPQTNGWVEFVSADPDHPGYSNNMIVEVEGRRGIWKNYGYYISLQSDSSRLVSVSQRSMNSFATTYLSDTPLAQKEALKYGQKNLNKTRKIFLASLMTAGLAGTIFMATESRWIFMAGFPLGA